MVGQAFEAVTRRDRQIEEARKVSTLGPWDAEPIG